MDMIKIAILTDNHEFSNQKYYKTENSYWNSIINLMKQSAKKLLVFWTRAAEICLDTKVWSQGIWNFERTKQTHMLPRPSQSSSCVGW